ncbi:MAG: hypothetical protein CVV27_05620 [Candidatus Melainabacteria bacterium HGW-Melainabacteria-1]|nr:MAG: hypothetical protein CVV27_05620 [Candidatus Melainabacteria bacterium HGW-Melainabacteria-1]
MLSRFKRTVCLALLTSLLILPGCMSRMAQDSAEQTQAEALIRQFATVMAKQDAEGLLEIASVPFWVDDWIESRETLREEFPDDAQDQNPELGPMELRIYPLADLAALRPKVWQSLKDSNPAWIQDMYVAAVAVEIDDRSESGLFLLRRVNGKWTLAGLIEE